MSSNLYWVPKTEDRNILPDSLKNAMKNSFTTFSGIVLDFNDLDYLRGLRDAGNEEIAEGAIELITAINEHDRVVLEED